MEMCLVQEKGWQEASVRFLTPAERECAGDAVIARACLTPDAAQLLTGLTSLLTLAACDTTVMNGLFNTFHAEGARGALPLQPVDLLDDGRAWTVPFFSTRAEALLRCLLVIVKGSGGDPTVLCELLNVALDWGRRSA